MTKIEQIDSKINSVTLTDQETIISVTPVTDITVPRYTNYRFKNRYKNPDWSPEKLIPLRSCHIHNKGRIIDPEVFISKIPKWITVLEKEELDQDTGELFYSDYQTDDFKAARHRKIKTVEKFCNYYEPLYKKRKVSLLFHTFTRINYAKQDMKRMMNSAKYRYESLNRPIRGYIWVLEISETNHIHYHLIVAVDRVKFSEIPKALKFEDLWGQRTGVEFIKKGIKCYLTKYLYKSDTRLLRKRSYAISRKMV